MKRSYSVRVSSTLASVGVLSLLAIAAGDHAGRAIAQDAPPDTSEPTTDTDEGPGTPPRAYFHLFTDGAADEIAYDDMSTADQEGIMLMAERTDYGADVHAAWSTVARQAVADAAAQRAAYAAGVNGLDETGVE